MEKRVAFVVDSLAVLGGAERVLDAAMEVFPQAPIYTLVYNRPVFSGTTIEKRQIFTSFVDRLPFGRTKYRNYLPLLPLAVEQFDLRPYDLVLSFSYAVAHGVLTRPDQQHISYTHTPLRQSWHYYHQYLADSGFRSSPKSWLARIFLHYLRLWDLAASNRVDHFLAASDWVARGIWRAYRRQAQVLYPPVDTDLFVPLATRQDYFLVVSRLEIHKKVDLAVQAFAQLPYPLIVVGDGQESRRIARQATDNVRVLGRQPDEKVQQLMGTAKALIVPGEEDFSIAAVEAQSAGCPVIAYGYGGVCETVIEGQTGLFFEEQTVESLVHAVQRFVQNPAQFETSALQRNAARFSRPRFQHALREIIAKPVGAGPALL